GAAGSLIVLLLWVYYSAQILFFGAEVTQVYARRHGSMRDTEPRSVSAPPAIRVPAMARVPVPKRSGGAGKAVAGGVVGLLVGGLIGLVSAVFVGIKAVKRLVRRSEERR